MQIFIALHTHILLEKFPHYSTVLNEGLAGTLWSYRLLQGSLIATNGFIIIKDVIYSINNNKA